MTCSIHSAQNDILSSDYTKMAAGLMGGMMAGQAVLEYGYDAAVWSAPYVKSAAVATYNAGKYAYTVSSNATKYYGSTAVLNGVKWYGKAKAMAEGFMSFGSGSDFMDMFLGGIYGYFQYEMPIDSTEPSITPMFDFGSKSVQIIRCIWQINSERK